MRSIFFDKFALTILHYKCQYYPESQDMSLESILIVFDKAFEVFDNYLSTKLSASTTVSPTTTQQHGKNLKS
jgi:hypothetical protein